MKKIITFCNKIIHICLVSIVVFVIKIKKQFLVLKDRIVKSIKNKIDTILHDAYERIELDRFKKYKRERFKQMIDFYKNSDKDAAKYFTELLKKVV